MGRRLFPLWLGLTALAGVLTLYLPSVTFDFYAEDFLSLRPWPPTVLWEAMTGTWQNVPDAPGFYRPMSVLYYWAAFELFGVNTAPLHVLPVVTVAATSSLIGWFVWRETASRGSAWLAAAIYAVHPATTSAVGPWIANQYQGFATICALLALIGWQRSRGPEPWSLRRWLAVGVPLVVAGLLKEDALMLPLILIVSQWSISRWQGPDSRVSPPGRGFVVAGVGLFGAMNLWRLFMLGGIGGYGAPPLDVYGMNLLRGPFYVMLVQLDAHWWIPATLWSGLVLIAGGIGIMTDRTAASTRLAITGLVVVTLANIPLAMMPSTTRGYLLVLGTTFVLTAGVATAARWAARTRTHAISAALLWTIVGLGLGSFVGVSQSRLHTFGPCSDDARTDYGWLRATMVPPLAPQLGPWLDDHIASCEPQDYVALVEALPIITWGLGAAPTPVDGVPVWAVIGTDGVQVLMAEHLPSMTLRLRHPDASQAAPVSVRIIVNGHALTPMALTSPEWLMVPISPSSGWRTRWRRAHRVDVRTSGRTGFEWQMPVVTP